MREWLWKLDLPEIDRLEMDHLLEEWNAWDLQVAALEQTIAARAGVREDAKLLMTTGGLGPYGALGLTSRIGDIRRFPRPRSLANYFGLTPRCRNSGEKTDRGLAECGVPCPCSQMEEERRPERKASGVFETIARKRAKVSGGRFSLMWLLDIDHSFRDSHASHSFLESHLD